MNAHSQALSAYAQGFVPEPVITSEHLQQVRRIALHLAARLPPNVDLDDLIQAGTLGLMEALRHYEDNRGARFETYAGIRIRGAMLDELRRNDWAPRSVHSAMRTVSKAMHSIEQKTGHPASEREVIEHLGTTAEAYREIVRDAAQCQMISMTAEDESGEIDAIWVGENPAEALENQVFQQAVSGGIDALPERERLLMSLYYDDELNLREIGTVLGVSESRACQLHGQALLRLKGVLAEWRDEAPKAKKPSSERSRKAVASAER